MLTGEQVIRKRESDRCALCLTGAKSQEQPWLNHVKHACDGRVLVAMGNLKIIFCMMPSEVRR